MVHHQEAEKQWFVHGLQVQPVPNHPEQMPWSSSLASQPTLLSPRWPALESGNQGCCHSSSASQVGSQSFIWMLKWRGLEWQQASGCESSAAGSVIFSSSTVVAAVAVLSELYIVLLLMIITIFLSLLTYFLVLTCKFECRKLTNFKLIGLISNTLIWVVKC